MSCTSKLNNQPFILLIIFLISTVAGKAQTNARVVSDEAKIYPEPNAHLALNISAREGDLFKVKEIREDWIQIYMFSGATRYIQDNNVEVTFEKPFDSLDPAMLGEFCGAIEKAQSKASEEASEKYVQDFRQQGYYEQLLFDRYVLNTFRAFDVPAINTSKLIECVDDKLF